MSLVDALLLDPHPLNVWIAYRTDGLMGTGTLSDPFNGSSATLFDEVLNELPARTCVHLGPSPRNAQENLIPFETRGYAVSVNSLRCGLVDGNVIDLPLDDADPNKGRQMRHDATQTVKFFANQRPDGHLLRGENGAAGRLDDELSTLIEDSMTMALL